MPIGARSLNADDRAGDRAGADRGPIRGLVVLAIALAPAIAAIAATPGFSTQDGPAHIYSARILNAELVGGSPFAATFRVAWEPLPNWAGHLLTMLAAAIWSPEVANRVVAAATLATFAAAILRLRWVVAGRDGIELAAILAAILALNVAWLLGFTSFILGASVATLTLASWWAGRDRFRAGQAAALGAWLVVGYFCHPISLGLTVGGLVLLALLTPGPARPARAGWTALAGLPLVPLVAAYLALTRSGGGPAPAWDHWSPSIAGLVSQVGWVDPLSLAAKTATPFDLRRLPLPAAALAPAAWAIVGLAALVGSTWRRRDRRRLGWLVMAAGLVGAGMVAPDTLGVKHGHFLPQRVVLLGLVALVPWLDLGRGRRGVRFAAGALAVALGAQSAFVWDYAATCRERVTPFLRVADQFDPGAKAGTLLNGIRGRFRANPVLHADCLIAAATDSLFWTNYETAQYYFPVKVRADVAHPVATEFERVAILDEPRDAARRARLWRDLLRDHAAQLDRIVEWQADPDLDADLGRRYRVTRSVGPIRIWSRMPPPPASD